MRHLGHGKLQFNNGRMVLPDAPGLGVEIDLDQMAKLKENVRKVKSRNDLLSKWNPNYPSKDERGWRWLLPREARIRAQPVTHLMRAA